MPPQVYQRGSSIPLLKMLRSEKLPQGGIHTYVEGFEFPYKGLPDEGAVYVVGMLKRGLRSYIKITGLNLIWLLIFYRDRLNSNFAEFLEASLRYFPYMQEVHDWCDAVREIFVTGVKVFGDGPLLRLICLTMEFDNAYRWRPQFFLSLMINNGKNLNDQVKIALDEMIRREEHAGLKKTYAKMKKWVWILSIPPINKKVKNFLDELDWKQVMPDAIDKEWFKLSNGFDFSNK